MSKIIPIQGGKTASDFEAIVEKVEEFEKLNVHYRKNFWQKMFDDPWQKIKDNPVAFVVGITGVVGTFFAIATAYLTEQTVWKAGLKFLAVFAVLVLVLYLLRLLVAIVRNTKDPFFRKLLWSRFSIIEKKLYPIEVFEETRTKKEIKKAATKKPYALKSRQLFYIYKDREHIYHSKIFEIIPKSDDLSTFTDRYVFSGEGELHMDSRFGPGRIKRQPDGKQYWRDHGWNFYQLEFDKLETRQNIESFYVGMKMDDIRDLNHVAKPFLSTGIYEPTEELIMKVYFGDLKVKNVFFLTFNSYVDMNPISYEHLHVDHTGCASVRVAYPIYHYKYMIKWQFDE